MMPGDLAPELIVSDFQRSVSNAASIGGWGCRCAVLINSSCVCAEARKEGSADRRRRVRCIAYSCTIGCTKPAKTPAHSPQACQNTVQRRRNYTGHLSCRPRVWADHAVSSCNELVQGCGTTTDQSLSITYDGKHRVL